MYLLDANALIALGWPTHEFHLKMRAWFRANARSGWATTALTQAAFVRIVAQPSFAGRSIAISEVAELLLRNLAHPGHRLLTLDFGFGDVMAACSAGLMGHRQITDAWLLTTAIRNGCRLLTFDAAISHLLATDSERLQHVQMLSA